MRFRALNRCYAAMFGYFWLPCPACGRAFGGHEWRPRRGHVDSIPDVERGPGASRGICPDCVQTGVGCEQHALLRGLVLHDCTASHQGLKKRMDAHAEKAEHQEDR